MKIFKKRVKIICFVVSSFFNVWANFSLGVTSQEQIALRKFGSVAYSRFATICNSYAIARECIAHNIPGDFVECGVAAGAQIGAIAWANQAFEDKRKIHLLDSFEGIPLAGPNDTQQPGIGDITHDTSVELDKLLVSSGISSCSVENVKKIMSRWNIKPQQLLYHKGWFQHTLPFVSTTIKEIAFLRLDGDLYESTKVCLEYLYPKVVKGGYVVIDDYALDGCRKAVEEYLQVHGLDPEIIKVEKGGGPVYWQVQ